MGTTIGTYVRERRQHLGLSQGQLADQIKDSFGGAYGQSDISRLERGEIDLPRLGTLIKLAAALEVSVGNLLIAAGWFDDEYFASNPTSDEADERDTLITVLGDIEAELDSMLDLEGEARIRSDRLRAMIRELQ